MLHEYSFKIIKLNNIKKNNHIIYNISTNLMDWEKYFKGFLYLFGSELYISFYANWIYSMISIQLRDTIHKI